MDNDMIGMEELTSPRNLRAYAAEFIGTLLFVLMGTAAVITVAGSGAQDRAGILVVVAMAHGLGIATMVYLTARVSGGHINPAVTVGMMATRRIKVAPGVAYIVAQMAGGAAATALLYVVVQNGVGNLTDFGAHGVNTAIVDGDGGAFLIEAVLTFALVMVVFATAVSKGGFGVAAPLAIGLTIMLIHFASVYMTGASVNPARTFGPALVSNAFDSFWLYLLGPAVGGVAGALVYQHVFLEASEEAA